MSKKLLVKNNQSENLSKYKANFGRFDFKEIKEKFKLIDDKRIDGKRYFVKYRDNGQKVG